MQNDPQKKPLMVLKSRNKTVLRLKLSVLLQAQTLPFLFASKIPKMT
jgi:hypothetical protein